MQDVFHSLGDCFTLMNAQFGAARRLKLQFDADSRIDMSNTEHVPYILGEVFSEIRKSNGNFFDRIRDAIGKDVGKLDYDLLSTFVDLGLMEKLAEPIQGKKMRVLAFQRGFAAFLDGFTLGPVFRAGNYESSQRYVKNDLDRIGEDLKRSAYRWIDPNLKIAKEILDTFC